MKAKNKIIFFFFFFIFPFIIISINQVSAFGNAFDPQTTTIKANWLYVTPNNFIDSQHYSWEDNLHIASGGEDLLEFENLGIVSSTDDEVVFKASATFGFEVTAHTSVTFRDRYPNINLNAMHEEVYFGLVDAVDILTTHTNDYSISWNYVDYGSTHANHYSGMLPITVGIKELSGNTGSITLNGKTFDTPDYTADILQVKVSNIRSGEVGGYGDVFTNIAGVSEGLVTLVEMDDFTTDQGDVIAWYNSRNIGWTEGSIEKGQTLQQSIIDGTQGGTTFHNPKPSTIKDFTFDLYTNLQPEVYEYVQYNTIRSARIRYWRWGFYAGTIETLTPPHSDIAPKRVTGVHVTNNFIHWDFNVDVEFYATIQSNAELTQAILDDPYLKMGDMVWDSSFTGDYNVEVPLDKNDFWSILDNLFGGLFSGALGVLTWIIIIIVVIVALYIFIRIGIPLIRRKIMRRGYY